MDPKTEPSKLEKLAKYAGETLFDGVATMVLAAGLDYVGNGSIDNPYISMATAAGAVGAVSCLIQEKRAERGESSDSSICRTLRRTYAFTALALAGQLATEKAYEFNDYVLNTLKVVGAYGGGFVATTFAGIIVGCLDKNDDDDDDDDDDETPEPTPDPASPRKLPIVPFVSDN